MTAQREYINRVRAEWRAAKLCADCGAETDAGEIGKTGKQLTGYRCERCRERAASWHRRRRLRSKG